MKGSGERLGKERSRNFNLQEPVKERETWRVREDRKHWGNERGVNISVEHVSRDDVSKQRNIPLNDKIHPGDKQLRSTENGEGAETKTAKEPENSSTPHKPVIQQDNKYSSSDNSENSKTKSGKINCICLYHTFDPEMLRCSSCGNFSHKTCYNSNLKSTHQCVCLSKEGVKCGNPKIDNHFSKKSRSIEENRAFVFNLNRKRVLKSILNQEFLTCQPGSYPSIEFLKIRFGYPTDYATRITLNLLSEGFITISDGFSFNAGMIIKELGLRNDDNELDEASRTESKEQFYEIGHCFYKIPENSKKESDKRETLKGDQNTSEIKDKGPRKGKASNTNHSTKPGIKREMNVLSSLYNKEHGVHGSSSWNTEEEQTSPRPMSIEGEEFGPSIRNMSEEFGPSIRNMSEEFGPSIRNMSEEFGPSLRNMSEESGPSIRNMSEESVPIIILNEETETTTNRNRGEKRKILTQSSEGKKLNQSDIRLAKFATLLSQDDTGNIVEIRNIDDEEINVITDSVPSKAFEPSESEKLKRIPAQTPREEKDLNENKIDSETGKAKAARRMQISGSDGKGNHVVNISVKIPTCCQSSTQRMEDFVTVSYEEGKDKVVGSTQVQVTDPEMHVDDDNMEIEEKCKAIKKLVLGSDTDDDDSNMSMQDLCVFKREFIEENAPNLGVPDNMLPEMPERLPRKSRNPHFKSGTGLVLRALAHKYGLTLVMFSVHVF